MPAGRIAARVISSFFLWRYLDRKEIRVKVDREAELELVKMVQGGELKNTEADWQALFHPDPVQTKGYALFGAALEGLPADEYTDRSVHHLAAIQGKDGRWFNNLPRPPIQTSDVGATAPRDPCVAALCPAREKG